MQKEEIFRSKIKKYAFLALIILVFIGLSFALLKVGQLLQPQEEFTPEMTKIDDPSGLDVYETNFEEEATTSELQNPLIIGIGILEDDGLSMANINYITKSLRDYFREKYPDVKRVSYLKDSFKSPDPNNEFLHEFTVVTDQGEDFKVTVNNYGTYSFIDMEITKS